MKRLLAFGERLSEVLKRPRLFAFVIPAAVPFFLASLASDPSATSGPTMASMVPSLRYTELHAEEESPLPAHSMVLPLERGDTFDTVFQAGGLTRTDSHRLTAELARVINPRRIQPGNLVRFHYDKAGSVDSVQVRITGWGELAAVRKGDSFEVQSREARRTEVETTISATVKTSLYEAIREAGEQPQLLPQLVEVFRWDIDFFELKRGDSFTLVVRKRFAGPDLIGYGPITAARFVHGGTTYEAFRHEAADGTGGYYARTGRPLRKQFLRAPLAFTRITSGFSKKRFHPILNYFRPHHGVDYGAPVGTPVMTTADGVVSEVRYSPGEGNVVRVKHSSSIETSYLHLSKFARGIKKGVRVRQGQVIGYVGRSGLATGPHLDYRVRDGKKWLDPLKLKSITPDPLNGESLRVFRADVARLTPRLETAGSRTARTETAKRALF